jgi:hypothetical protein
MNVVNDVNKKINENVYMKKIIDADIDVKKKKKWISILEIHNGEIPNEWEKCEYGCFNFLTGEHRKHITKEVDVIDWWFIMQKNTFDSEDERLLFDMHRRIPPLRSGDLWNISLNSRDSKNYIINGILHLNEYKTYSTYGEIKIKLDDKIKLPDRKKLFDFKTRDLYIQWANSIVRKYFPTMTLHKFRHSFLRSKINSLPDPIIARMMCHSMEQQLIYAHGYQFNNWYKIPMEWQCPY